MEALVNHIFFCTLTYNDDFLPSLVVNGYNIKYADMNDLVLTFKRIRNGNLFGRPFRTFQVSELGKQRGRPHFHVLFLVPKYPDDDYNTCVSLALKMHDVVLSNWSANIGTRKNPIYVPRCTYVSKFVRGRLCRNFDLHYVSPSLTANGTSDVAFYVLKYMMKTSTREQKLQQALRLNLVPEEYDRIWDIVKPRWHSSKGFGLGQSVGINSVILQYLRDCVAKTPKDSPFPMFFSPDTGMSFPLCPYYKNIGEIFSIQDALTFYYNGRDILPDDRVDDQAIKRFKEYSNKVLSADLNGSFPDF